MTTNNKIFAMARELFKNATASNIHLILQEIKAPPLTSFTSFPKSFVVAN